MSVKVLYVIFVLFTFTIKLPSCVLSAEYPVCDDSNSTAKSTAESCCPCFRENMTLCDTNCPDGYLSINQSLSLVTCETNSSLTPGLTTTVKVPVSTETENSTMSAENTTESTFSGDNEYVIICSKSCPDRHWYNNETKQCLNCDQKCLECNLFDGDNCTVCKYLFNETCLAGCPQGMVESKNKTNNGSILCEIAKPAQRDEKNLPIPIIAGAAGGGAVVIIIIIVIVCCCCHRRHRNKETIGAPRSERTRTTMSVILEQGANEQRTNKRGDVRPQGYENIEQALPSNTDIQRQGDMVLRYTKDPTVKEKSKEDETAAEESPYGNIAMVRLAEKVDLTNKKSDDLKEMLEVEEMGDAPQAPMPLPVSAAVKKRTGIVKKLSQRVSKKLGRKKDKGATLPTAHIPEDYVDMSGRPESSSGMYVPPSTDTDRTPAEELEDYENVDYNKIPQGRQARKVKGHDTKAETKPEETSLIDEQEVYENAPGAQSDNTKEEEDLEDYENTKELSKKPKGKEPAKELNKKSRGKDPAKEFSKKPKPKEEPINDESNDLEDYENMKDLELYENTEFHQKK